MYVIIKRLLDIILSSLLLLILSPIFCLISVLILINLGRPVFFQQERTGMKGKRFKIIKFRTMKNTKDKKGNYLPDEQRFTKFGLFLRSMSLDEIPELFNIILGTMSIIGPRPLPPSYDKYYYEYELKRFDIRSGLIPPDSVDTNPIISWDRQFEYEVEYAENYNFIYDCKIFFNVFRILFKRSDNKYGEYVRKPLDIERKNN